MQKISIRRRALLPLLAAASLGISATTSAQSISTLMFFDGTTAQGGLVRGADGALYGTGSESAYSTSSIGMYFRLATDGSAVQTIYEYGREGVFTGAGPRAALLLASDGNFYGTTSYNSFDALRRTQQGTGTIFRMSQDGKTYTKLFEFDPFTVDRTRNSIGYAVNDTGADPQASLIEGVEAGVTYLYGTTLRGGDNGTGVIFKIRADGTGFQTLHHFGEAITVPVLDSNGNPTFQDGFPVRNFDNNSDGRLRSADGVNPNQRLALVGGRLFGVTTNGGPNGTGVVYSVRTDGTDFYSTAFDVSPATISDSANTNFGLPKTNTTGAYPASNLILASDNRLYGTASSHGGFTGAAGQGGYGGGSGFGTIYRIDPAANPIVIESVLAFNGVANPAPGAAPAGELIIGSDGQLVGTLANGGIRDATTTPVTGGAGAIFKFNTTTSAYTTPFVFAADNTNVYNYGASPAAGVIEVPEGSGVAYFGVASQGGANGRGSVFKFGAPVTIEEPLGTPQPYDDGGGALSAWLLLGIALLGAALFVRRARRQISIRG